MCKKNEGMQIVSRTDQANEVLKQLIRNLLYAYHLLTAKMQNDLPDV
jgi:hypothetical protein